MAEGGNLKVLCWSRKNRSPSPNESREYKCDGKDLTGSGQRVLQGTNWQVQGYNGSNAAQPSQPWGSTLTFQRKAGVSWVLGLRHGVTMHPRGRHLRGDRTLLLTWKSNTQARESSHHINSNNYYNHYY